MVNKIGCLPTVYIWQAETNMQKYYYNTCSVLTHLYSVDAVVTDWSHTCHSLSYW